MVALQIQISEGWQADEVLDAGDPVVTEFQRDQLLLTFEQWNMDQIAVRKVNDFGALLPLRRLPVDDEDALDLRQFDV